MTDRELLTAAAEAAGIEHRGWTESGAPVLGDRGDWSPLEDDGDALRLAVKLRLPITYTTQVVFAGALWEEFGSDPTAALRRAIVRAAAAIRGERKGTPHHG